MTTPVRSPTRPNNECTKYTHHHHFHHSSNHNLHHQTLTTTTTTFLPLLCRASFKDVSNTPRLQGRSASFSDDPTSPKVSCIGQVKRNNKVNGFPTPLIKLPAAAVSTKTTTSNQHQSHHFRYTKLKRFFSAKNINTTTTPSAAAATGSGGATTTTGGTAYNYSCRSRRSKYSDESDECVRATVNVLEMDPPLPVIKKVQQPGGGGGGGGGREEVNIWKRRAGGFALKGLEIQQLSIPNRSDPSSCFQHPPTTV